MKLKFYLNKKTITLIIIAALILISLITQARAANYSITSNYPTNLSIVNSSSGTWIAGTDYSTAVLGGGGLTLDMYSNVTADIGPGLYQHVADINTKALRVNLTGLIPGQGYGIIFKVRTESTIANYTHSYLNPTVENYTKITDTAVHTQNITLSNITIYLGPAGTDTTPYIAYLNIYVDGINTSAPAAANATITTNITPKKIFKCQETEILINLSGYIVHYVYVNVNISGIIKNGSAHSEANSYNMTNLTDGRYVYYYGNDPNMLWGNKTITYKPDTMTLIDYNDHIFVYSDECTGANIQGYRNTSFEGSFGNYTGAIFRGEENILQFAEKPFLINIGYVIYILVMGTICLLVYIGSQSVMSPIIIVFITAASLIGSGVFPQEYRIPALLITAAATAAIFWRLGKSA
jgi:hypothetical protein